jgi:hypothetical protein
LILIVPVDAPDPGAALASSYTKNVRHIARTNTARDGQLDRFQQTAPSPLFFEPRYWDLGMSLLDMPATAAGADQHVGKLYSLRS